MNGAQLRLYAWSQLPDLHRNEICRQVRVRCDAFIGSVRVEKGQRRTEVDRLVSEVVAHLLRATSLQNVMENELSAVQTRALPEAVAANVASSAPPPWLALGRIDDAKPSRDARVIWLLDETCNRQALLHRYEDMRRRDRGGKWDGSGYPLIAVDEQTMEQLSGHYDPAESEVDALQAEDSRRAWAGLMYLAEHQFGPADDVIALVQVLAQDRETQESFGSQWPIGKIVRALNAESQASWTDDRVENAKRRLVKFILRFKQEHGLDAVDLRALLARYARQRQAVLKRSAQPK
jgi:hypothetical protein